MIENLQKKMMSGGEAIVQSLLQNNVNTVFGIPGAQTYPIFDALARVQSRIKTIGTRHEQAAAYMAFGYAKSLGLPGVYSVVPGPGVLNTMAALCTAWGANVPVLCLTGQIPREAMGKLRGHLHELPDQIATLKTLTKWSVRIERVADAPEIINEAFKIMSSGRPGPVSVEMCWDDMAQNEMVGILPPAEVEPTPTLNKSEIDSAVKLIKNAKAPIILVGSGAQHASAAVLELAELLQAPVSSFRGGRGVVSEDHELGVSSLAAHDLWRMSDVLIGIGSRLEMPYMRWSNPMGAVVNPLAPPHLIRIDIDPEEMTRLVPHAGIVADAEQGTRALTKALKGHFKPRSTAISDIAHSKDWANKKVQEIKPHVDYLKVIREVLPRDGFFVEEISQIGFTSQFAFPVYEPRTYVTCGFQGNLGFGFQSALGVKVANPDKVVISVTGDGGFMFGVQELATAAQENIGLITIIMNNSAFANVRRDMRRIYKRPPIGSDLKNPDFIALAEAFGIKAHAVDDPIGLRKALDAAIEDGGPAVIEVKVDRNTEKSPWKYILMTYS
ncbi:thiamine pyrophosphate-binding protein [Gammaproteobacteria bacterium]|nr:thiamine pyrophosphate-binding protein [Gammaproteobacteria bacterium]